MKKLIDIDENYLSHFRKVITLQNPEIKITDKMLVNTALIVAVEFAKKTKINIVDINDYLNK